MKLCTRVSRHGWKQACAFRKSPVMASFLSLCRSCRHTLRHRPTRDTYCTLTTTPSLPRHVQDPLWYQTNSFSCPITIPQWILHAQPEGRMLPVFSRPVTQECMSESPRYMADLYSVVLPPLNPPPPPPQESMRKGRRAPKKETR